MRLNSPRNKSGKCLLCLESVKYFVRYCCILDAKLNDFRRLPWANRGFVTESEGLDESWPVANIIHRADKLPH